MLWRHPSLVRAFSAAGLLSFLTLVPTARAGEPADPVPTADAQAETVNILDAKKAGDLAIDVRGHGQSLVKVAIKNTSKRRLNVVIPAGLVAASSTGQAGGAGAGGGLQNMGLGAPGNRPGGFGQFGLNGNNPVGFRSVGLSAENKLSTVTVAVGQSLDLDMPAVCLNFGLPSPVMKDRLTLVDVGDYSRDPRVRKALRSVGTFGTSQGTAQAIMWNVCNGVAFARMTSEGEKFVNRHEVALAARFVEALDDSSTSELVDFTSLSRARIFVTFVEEKGLEKDAQRLATEMEGLRVLGLPVQIVAAKDLPKAVSPALHLVVNLTDSKVGETSGKILVRHNAGIGRDAEWANLGKTSFKETSAATALKGIDIARAVDHALAAEFVSARPTRKSIGNTEMRVENRLPFSLSSVTLKATGSAGSPSVTFTGLGIGPVRSGIVDLQAANGTVERVELNGL